VAGGIPDGWHGRVDDGGIAMDGQFGTNVKQPHAKPQRRQGNTIDWQSATELTRATPSFLGAFAP
jgi:hypothetical protein